MKTIIAAFTFLIALAAPATGQAVNSEPRPAPAAAALPVARDVTYPGTIQLHVDTSDVERQLWRIRQTIPVARSGRVTLLYPEWIPGNHAPRGPIYNYAGLVITANGKTLPWTRDPGSVYAFHVDVPPDAKSIDVEAQFLTPIESAQGGAIVTPEMLRLNWYQTALYPAGHYARRIPFDVTLKLPEGWNFATALETAAHEGDIVTFKPVSFETLLDSPLYAGRNMLTWDLDPGGRSRVTLNAFGDTPEMVAASDDAIRTLRTLVVQADKLFGARHFDHYDFLLSVSDVLATSGIEHQRSSSNGVTSGYFTAWNSAFISKDLLAHEYVHSWNGKYRRPADLWTPHYNTPMRGSLLWVYEGQTQYWGHVLAARSGFVTRQQALDTMANTAALYQTRTGRNWRPLSDTVQDPVIAARRSLPWSSWQRSEDYYSEGLLIWLDVDTLIRERTGGKRSLDDFARTFFGMNDGDWGQLTYTFEDLTDALSSVDRMDWSGFLRGRVDAVAPQAPLDGIERGGYRLVYQDRPNSVQATTEARTRAANHSYSIGLTASAAGDITNVMWEGPAFNAGLSTAGTIVSVNGRTYTADRLKEAIAETASGKSSVDLTVRVGDRIRPVKINYTGGLKYPKLERIEGKPALLDDILAPR